MTAAYIVRVRPQDARKGSDHLRALREIVTAKEEAYPGIKTWFDQKVVDGLSLQERIGYVAYLNERAVAAGIVKLGQDSKICHLSVSGEVQRMGIGSTIFRLMAAEAAKVASRLHFTIPEGTWASSRLFFEAHGFTIVRDSMRRYRRSERELYVAALAGSVLDSLGSGSPARTKEVGEAPLVMSLRPEFADMILRGVKTVEIRRRFSSAWVGRKVVFYAGLPVGAIVGEARIQSVFVERPQDIWQRFGPAIGCSVEYFAEYVSGRSFVAALQLEEVAQYPVCVPLTILRESLGGQLVPPQSYLLSDKRSDWKKAVACVSPHHKDIRR